MGLADDDPAQLKRRAGNLREYARQARTLAQTLGPYLDGAVAKATPRTDDPSAPGAAIWTGPYADQCTATLTQRRSTLHSMASALMTDAKRWESAAADLEDQAASQAKNQARSQAASKKKNSPVGGG